MILDLIADPKERRVMELMHKGFAPSQIAKITLLDEQLVHDLVVANWARDKNR